MRLHGPSFSRLIGSWSVDLVPVALLVLIAAVYLLGVRRAHHTWPAWRAGSFLAGLFVLALALLSGIDGYGDELLSVHVVQHLLLILLAPMLLLWGSPVRLALSASPPAGRRRIGRLLRSRVVGLLTNPVFAFGVFAVVVLGTHMTGLYDTALEDPLLHELEHAAYFWAGLLFLVPLVAADPIPHPPGPIARFSWLMGGMIVMSVPGALLTFAAAVRYPFYLEPARELGRSALADQHLAGTIMWVAGGLVMFLLALSVAMGAMLAEERRQQHRERHARDEAPVGVKGALEA